MSKTLTPTYEAPSPGMMSAFGDAMLLQQLKALAAAGALTDVAVFNNLGIVQEGKKIILPQGMSMQQAIEQLQRMIKEQEQVINVSFTLDCFPLDGVVALHTAMKEIYGFTELKGSGDGWWAEPPRIVQIPTVGNQFASAVISRMAPKLWEGGYLEPVVTMATSLTIVGAIKKKFEPEIQSVLTKTRQILKEQSIYKGQCIRLEFNWIEQDRKFDPIKDAPTFWNTESKDELILNPETQFSLETSLYLRLEKEHACLANNIPLKTGALLIGSYGTGKTLAAKEIARKATENGWTFIYLAKCGWVAQALKIAALYAPCVLFAEDIDQATNRDRDGYLNEILNTLDGVDTKGKPIISVFTSNHPEKINRAFLRAQRMDAIIPFGPPNAETAKRFVEYYGRDSEGQSLLAPDLDFEDVGVAVQGMKPSFIATILQSAKARALYRTGKTNIVGQITTEDIVLAVKASQQHAQLVAEIPKQTDQDRVMESLRWVNAGLRGDVPYTKSEAPCS